MAMSILPGEGLRVATHPPGNAVAGVVHSYWTMTVDTPPATVRVVPDGLVDVIIEVSARQAFVNGVRAEPASYRHDRPTELLGASLQPGTVVAVLGVHADGIADRWQPLADIIGPVADDLVALVLDAATPRDRLAILDAFFLARIFATATEPRVRKAVDAIVDSDGSIDVDTLGRHAGASPRNLGRLFDAWVGMSPKRFARVVRLQTALRRMQDDPRIPLATLARESGYADQAHLAREMQALAAISPRDLARDLSDSFKT